MITNDIPPFSVVVGNPSKIIKRYDFESGQWIKGDNIHNNAHLDEDTYLEYLRNKFNHIPLAYFSGSSQFGDLYN